MSAGVPEASRTHAYVATSDEKSGLPSSSLYIVHRVFNGAPQDRRFRGGTNYQAVVGAGALVERDVYDGDILTEAKDFPADFLSPHYSHDLWRVNKNQAGSPKR